MEFKHKFKVSKKFVQEWRWMVENKSLSDEFDEVNGIFLGN